MKKNNKIAATTIFLLSLFITLVHGASKVHSGIIRKSSRWVVAYRVTSPRPTETVVFCKRC